MLRVFLLLLPRPTASPHTRYPGRRPTAHLWLSFAEAQAVSPMILGKGNFQSLSSESTYTSSTSRNSSKVCSRNQNVCSGLPYNNAIQMLSDLHVSRFAGSIAPCSTEGKKRGGGLLTALGRPPRSLCSASLRRHSLSRDRRNAPSGCHFQCRISRLELISTEQSR